MIMYRYFLITIVVVFCGVVGLRGVYTHKYGRVQYPAYPPRSPPPDFIPPLPDIIYAWKLLNYSFPTEAIAKATTGKSTFDLTNQLPIDVQPYYNGK